MQAFGGDEDSASSALLGRLAEDVAALAEQGTLTIAELASAGIVRWTIRRDEDGTPGARFRRPVPWASLQGEAGALDRAGLLRAAGAESGSPMVIVCTAPGVLDVSPALQLLRYARPGTAVFQYAAPLGELIGRVIAHAPLTQWYELVVLRQRPSGQLTLGGCQLFPIGAQRGDRWPFEIRCEPGGEDPTVFAVVASEPVRQFRLVSVQSARLRPGHYSLTAELVRPGLVRFDGLPVPLQPEHRSWAELVATVPEQVRRQPAAHLVCVVEISGVREHVQERLSRVNQLVRRLATSEKGELQVSLIAYGPHSFGNGPRDAGPEILTWAGTGQAALAAIGQLRDRPPPPAGYPHAAQLECVLAEVAGRLADKPAGSRGRPVLIAVGARPPFPPRVDPYSGILPCPRRADWRTLLQRLRQHGVSFGAIRDGAAVPFPDDDPDDDIWSHLGSGAAARVDAIDMPAFAADLGLAGQGEQHVPFPVIDGEGS